MFKISIDLHFEEQRLTNAEIEKIFNKALLQVDKKKHFEIDFRIESKPVNFVDGRRSHIAFLEVSTGHPFIMFNSGFLTGRNAELVFVQHKDGIEKKDLPQPVANNIIVNGDLDKLLVGADFQAKLRLLLHDVIKNYFKFRHHLEKFWFASASAKMIQIVGVRDFDPDGGGDGGKPLDRRNEDIYPFGDKDTFNDACMFLSKYYQDFELKRRVSDERINTNGNLLIIGGPGIAGDVGNQYCKLYMDLINSRVGYAVEEQKEFVMEVDGQRYRSIADDKADKLLIDYGYFACFTHPEQPETRVVLINGTHTLGVLGAFLAFSDNVSAEINYRVVLEKAISIPAVEARMGLNEMLDFECFFEVAVTKEGIPVVPQVKREHIFFLNSEVKPARNGGLKKRAPKKSLTELKETILLALKAERNRRSEKEMIQSLIDQYEIRCNNLSPSHLQEIMNIIESNPSIPPGNLIKIQTKINASTS